MPNLLFVCTGNTCRSPMAEGLARAILTDAARADITVQSAGTHAWPGMSASENARRAMSDAGHSIDAHLSSALTPELLAQATLTLAMTRSHLDIILALCPDARATTLAEYVGKTKDISDPFGGDIRTYKKCLAQIRRLIKLAAPKIKEELC